jgi:transcriptional regulator of NAD metabolism
MNKEETEKVHNYLKLIRTEYSSTFSDTNIEDLKDSCEIIIEKINKLKEKKDGEIWSNLSYSEEGIDINIYRRETDEEYLLRKEKSSVYKKINNRKQALEILKNDDELLSKIKSNVDIDTMLTNLKNG